MPPTIANQLHTLTTDTHRGRERDRGGEREREGERDRYREGGEREREGEREGERDKERETESLKPLTKMHFVIKMWPFFLCTINTRGLSSCVRGIYFALKCVFPCIYLGPLNTNTVIRKTKGGSDSSSVSVMAMCWLPFSTVCYHLINWTPVWSEWPTRQCAIKLTLSCSPQSCSSMAKSTNKFCITSLALTYQNSSKGL